MSTATPTARRQVSASPEARAFAAQVRDVLRELAILLRNAQVHDLTNDVFSGPRLRLAAALRSILTTERELKLELLGQEFFANGARLRMEIRSLHAYQFVAAELTRKGLGGVLFTATPSAESLLGLLSVLAVKGPRSDEGPLDVRRALAEKGVSDIDVLPPRQVVDRAAPEVGAPSRKSRAAYAYREALAFIRESMAALDSPADLNVRLAKRTIQRLVDLSYEDGEGVALLGMASMKDHDHYTFNHMVNVCVLAITFGQKLGLERNQLTQLGLCALYHDMGKLHIPRAVLNKPGRFTEEEWALMGNHTVYAARCLFPLIEGDLTAMKRILTALQHHVRFDGSGYPPLRLFRKQTLFTRITAIADAFDAMTTRRVYQRTYLPDEALATILKRAGTHYDPVLVKAFINCMGLFPVGSTVLLSTGELAVVTESNLDPELLSRPKVKVVAREGQRLDPPLLLNLAEPDEPPRQILRCVDPEAYGIGNLIHGNDRND